jgi:pimeloyl-ACP methyl ester carboxylesterase
MDTSAEGVRRREIRVAGIRSPLLEAGPGESDEAAVFVHGNPGSGEDWRELVARTGEFGRAVAPDMPGFGRADKPEDFDYTVGGYARHLNAVMQELGIRRAHLVLHDFGGPWGLAWAAAHPDRFASITLINIGVMPGYRWHYLARIWRTPLLGELFMATSTRAGFRFSLKHGNPRGLPRAFVDRMYHDFDRGTRRAVLRLYRATNDPGGEMVVQLTAALRSLDRPALVLWGRHDPYVPSRFAEYQREVFPRARIVLLENSGHWPFADDPESVGREVVSFLREQLGAPEKAAASPATSR